MGLRVLTAALAAWGCCLPASEPSVSGPTGPGWKQVFADEFEGMAADLDRIWESQNGPSGHILCSRWRENAVLEGGLLRLVARKEPRGGQEWTAASLWTRRTFRYGYFECRYRYAPATGTNNSFWIMTRGRAAPRFEIDINEGHYPNEVNMNLHNHSGEHWSRGGRWYLGGQGPGSGQDEAGFQFALDPPLRAAGLRLVSGDGDAVRLMEFRAFPPSNEGYPSVFPNLIEAQPEVPNLARGAAVEASSVLEARYGPERAIDGLLGTASRWVSARGGPPHVFTLTFDRPRKIGCIQFISGWQNGEQWQDIVNDFRIEYREGEDWRPVPGADRGTLTGRSQPAAADGPNLANEFHTYALEWTEDELVYFFDGQEIRRQAHDICRGEAHVFLSLAVMGWAGPVTDAIDGTSMDVDYVRVWQRAEAE
ncbi:MAG: family 16 glycosylhydrolase [Lentisphaeria bacterium]|nr:family 16 glycosylhydrolase [Lentisphaeria bacterium]